MGMPNIRDSGDGMTQFGRAQIDFADEDPSIFAEYAAELAAKGVELRQEKPVYRKG
jgi:hypothetical protein